MLSLWDEIPRGRGFDKVSAYGLCFHGPSGRGCAHGDRNVLFSQTVARREVSQIKRNFASILRHRLAYQFSKGHKNDADLQIVLVLVLEF